MFLKITNLKRISITVAAMAISCLLSVNTARAQEKNEYFLGNPSAKVTLIEYGSLTCSHCADFQEQVYPKIYEKYVASGKVKYIFRTLPTPPFELAIGLQVIADCAGNQRYKLIDEFYKNQGAIFASTNTPNGPLLLALKIAKRKTGLEEDDAKACLSNQMAIQKVQNIAQHGADTFKINSTPNFIINGKLMNNKPLDAYSFEYISKRLDEALLKSNTQIKKAK